MQSSLVTKTCGIQWALAHVCTIVLDFEVTQ